MKILITGASGIIGQKLYPNLAAAGYQLRFLVQENEIVQSSNFDITVGDLLDNQSLLQATKDIDLVIHLAGITHTNHKDLYYKINTQGTRNLLQACQTNKVKRFIFISSRTAGKQAGDYALSKLQAEQAVRQSKLNWLILRVAEVYGPGVTGAINQLINLVQKSPIVPIIGNGTYGLCPVYIDDVVDCLKAAVIKNELKSQLYVVAGPREISYNELVGELTKFYQRKITKVYIPIWLAKFAANLAAFLNSKHIVKDQIPRMFSSQLRWYRS